MATIGLKYLVYSKLDETGASPTYTGGGVIAKAISAELSVEKNEAQLYGDDAIAENISEFKNGTLKIGGDNIAQNVYADLLGHSLVTISGEQKKVVAAKNDIAPYVGVGFYAKTIKNNVAGYRAIAIKKAMFSEPDTSFATKGDSIEFQTPEVEATFFEDKEGNWKTESTFSTESAARNWLETELNIVSHVATPVADVEGGVYSEPQTVSLSCATDDAVISYCTDGGDPDTEYTTSLSIDATTVLKFNATKEGLADSETVTEIYIINA